jgi:Mg2+-importing ATPase
LVLLLLALGVLSFLTGDLRATVVIFVMVVLGVVLRFFQEMRADNAAAKLQAMVSNTATLVRGGKEEEISAWFRSGLHFFGNRGIHDGAQVVH